VADNGSTDGSAAVCSDFSQVLPLRVIDASAHRGQAHARNLGADTARGRKLVFLDQDDVISPGYLAAMDRALDDHEFVAATMDYETLNPEWAVRARQSSLAGGLRLGLSPWAYGCTLGVLRSTFEAAHGFDAGLVCAEDMDLCWRLTRHQGVVLHLVPDAVLHYRLKQSSGALFRQGLLYGRGGAALYRRWGPEGMARRSPGAAARSWAGIARRGLVARDRAARAEAWYLAGNRLGCAVGSVRERVVFL
jgi:glycosyltransferase involved in cell wall biosynthesis